MLTPKQLSSKKHFNRLTPAQHERLSLLLEEMGEAQQVIGKIFRHGYESYHPDDPSTTNRALLEKELGDVEAAMKIMYDRRDISLQNVLCRVYRKLEKVWEFMHHNVPVKQKVP